LMRQAISRCRLDLSGAVVLTEAASGAYVVTPVLAALAGAERVVALTRATRYGTVEEVTARTLGLAEQAGVGGRVEVVVGKTVELVGAADIVTNSGHLRPIDAEMIGWMKPGAVVSLMYEAWECRPGDVDLAACRERGIRVAGTNERHPAVDVFGDLGIMAVKLLLDAGVSVRGCDVLLLCNNDFGPFIMRGLKEAGAWVTEAVRLADVTGAADLDAVVLALHPRGEPVFSAANARLVATRWPGAVIAQFWGDVDRPAASAASLPVWPLEPPAPGHMGILPSAVGPDPIVRLQAGGLKVAEVLARGVPATAPDFAFVQELTA
jgi:hypothetical protein